MTVPLHRGPVYRVVLDTNVIVSSLLVDGSVPAEVVDLVVGGRCKWLVDGRIVAEYRDVLRRPHLRIDAARVQKMFDVIEAHAIRVVADPLDLALPDPSDRPFVEVAVGGGAQALVTGNVKDYQIRGGGKLDIAIVTPRQFLDLLARR